MVYDHRMGLDICEDCGEYVIDGYCGCIDYGGQVTVEVAEVVQCDEHQYVRVDDLLETCNRCGALHRRGNDRRSEVRCKRCGRLLTDPVSIERGIGPVCAGVGHRTNRYKKPKKRAAYECALKLAEQIDDIWQRGIYWDIFSRLDPDLSREDRRQVAAKAVRVTRGKSGRGSGVKIEK